MSKCPKVMLCTLVLNEMEWLPRLYEQHKHWPWMVEWVFVESADITYANSNPLLVSDSGLSTDGTTEWLEKLSQSDRRVVHIKHGICQSTDAAQAKVQSRNRYMDEAQRIEPTNLVVLDGDEFYSYSCQERIGKLFEFSCKKRVPIGWVIPKREIWRPPSIADRPLLELEVVGGFWRIPCCHLWRWASGMRYRDNHNNPKDRNGEIIPLVDLRGNPDSPQMLHMGFASSKTTRLAKNKYYEERGEATDNRRSWYVKSRAAWVDWKPGTKLPRGAGVIPYDGPVPEVFRG